MGASPTPCVAAMRHRLSAASLRLQGPAQGRRCPSVRRSLCPLQSDQQQAGRALERSGCGGSRFFFPAISPAMRKVRGPFGTGPCSAPGLGPMCMSMVASQPGSFVTVLVSESVWGRYDRIFRFRSNPFPAARELPCPGPQPTGPFVHCSLCVCHSTWRPAVQVPGRCGSRGSSLVSGSCFPGVCEARGWSRSASLAPRATAHHARVR